MRHRWTFLVALALSCALATPAGALEPDREKPSHGRMLIETGVYLLLGTVWYFSGQDLNAPDWDLEVTGDDLRLKFLTTSQIRFDNNTFLFNQAYHPLAHAGIHLTARANDMSPYVAFLYTFFASLFWEYVGELREKVSINDMIVSPMTGMAWGEVAYQYGEYFNSRESHGRTVHRVLTGLVGLPRLFHDWLDDEEPTVFEEPRFFPEPRAAAVAGAREYKDGAVDALTTFEIESELAVMPGFGQPGVAREGFRDSNFSSLSGEFQFTRDQVEIDLDATATLSGVYWRRISPDGVGFEAMIGGGRGYRLMSRDGDTFSDRAALAHLVGPTSRLVLHGPGRLRIDLALDAFFDFSAVRSHAVSLLLAQAGEGVLDEIRTDTAKHAYYFGLGFTFSPSLAIDVGGLRFELGTDISRVHSIQGLDRFQENVTRTIILDDLLFASRAAVVVPIWRLLDIRLQAHIEERGSTLDDLRAKHRHRELQLGLQSRF